MALGTATISFEEGVHKLFADATDRVRKAIQEMNASAIEAAEKMLEMQKKHQIETVRIEAQELEKFDVIVEYHSGKKPTLIPVEEIEHSACSSRGTHVNKKSCYDARALVWVRT